MAAFGEIEKRLGFQFANPGRLAVEHPLLRKASAARGRRCNGNAASSCNVRIFSLSEPHRRAIARRLAGCSSAGVEPAAVRLLLQLFPHRSFCSGICRNCRGSIRVRILCQTDRSRISAGTFHIYKRPCFSPAMSIYGSAASGMKQENDLIQPLATPR